MDKINYKDKSYSSAPVSIASAELMKKHQLKSVNRSKRSVHSKTMNLKCGEITFSQKYKNIDPYNKTGETDLEIINRYKSINLSRLEFQFFLAIFDIFLVEYNRTKNLKRHIFLTLKDFHNRVLGISNRIRKEDIENYIDIFDTLSTKLITIDTSTVIKKRKKKLFIHGPIANISIISIPEEKFHGLEIHPTAYINYECVNSKNISNYLPKDFIQLDMRENDNVLFFGYYFVRMHKINKRTDATSKWESSIFKVINNAIPDIEEFLYKYAETTHKSQFLKRFVVNPLEKALKILKNNNYVLEYKLPKINSKNLFGEEKILIVFNYDKSKFKLLNT